jgi:hypothetical protein
MVNLRRFVVKLSLGKMRPPDGLGQLGPVALGPVAPCPLGPDLSGLPEEVSAALERAEVALAEVAEGVEEMGP